MPKIAYQHPEWLSDWLSSDDSSLEDLPKPTARKIWKIIKAIDIIEEYQKQGYQLTLRQLYYQFVSRNLIPNKQSEYSNLGSAVNSGRLWGLIDWDSLVDRARNFEQRSHWSGPDSIIEACARSYSIDCWADSEARVEVWVEKQALEDVVARPATRYDVGYIACKGYMSQSEMWAAAQRLIGYEEQGQNTIIFYLGDHDPSGVDMNRDIQDRLKMFGSKVEVERIALTMAQIQHYGPPPNPAKITDSRSKDYIARFGNQSWELDALEPSVIDDLISDHIKEFIDPAYHQRREQEATEKSLLQETSDQWDDVVSFMGENE